MIERHSESITYFSTFEQREAAFRDSALALIPRKQQGPAVFWRDFKQISQGHFLKISQNPIAFITSNPRDCIAFGTGQQVLSAAVLCANHASMQQVLTVAELAEKFDLSTHLHQPIRTLSGGETVKLAMAKSFAAAFFSSRLVIASPFSWLSQQNTVFFDTLISHYQDNRIPLDIFALKGEDSQHPINGEEREWFHGCGRLNFGMCLEDVHLKLGTSLNSLYSNIIHVNIHSFTEELQSPCLIVGDNGQGKSLVAKILAGAIPFDGDAMLNSSDRRCSVRLLFQDCIAQTLLRSMKNLFRTNGAKREKDGHGLFHDLNQHMQQTEEDDANGSPFEINTAGSLPSLTDIKCALIAARLSQFRCALILDEPDWGMSRNVALRFVAAVVSVAHQHHVPVMIISHKSWWQTIAGSMVEIIRTPTVSTPKGRRTFQVTLNVRPIDNS